MDLKVKKTRMISFDNDGNILSIGKKIVQDSNTIEVNIDDVKDLLSGKYSFASHKVQYDFLEKKFVLKNQTQLQEESHVNSFLFEIETNVENPQIKIIQDKSNYQWVLEIDKEFETQMLEKNIPVDTSKHFYSITKKGDPNILYRMIQFETKTIPFAYDFELDDKPFSIYTTKKFHSYGYEVVDG